MAITIIADSGDRRASWELGVGSWDLGADRPVQQDQTGLSHVCPVWEKIKIQNSKYGVYWMCVIFVPLWSRESFGNTTLSQDSLYFFPSRWEYWAVECQGKRMWEALGLAGLSSLSAPSLVSPPSLLSNSSSNLCGELLGILRLHRWAGRAEPQAPCPSFPMLTGCAAQRTSARLCFQGFSSGSLLD